MDLKTMDKKKLGILIAAIVAGLLAAVMANKYVEENISKQVAILNKGPSREEVQAIMQRVQRLERDNQQLVASMRRMAAQRAVPSRVKGTKEQAKPQSISLSMKTPHGKRAITALVDKLYAAEGLIKPGDFVDVLVHLNVPVDPFQPKKTEAVTVMLFQNVQILAMGTILDASQAAPEKTPSKIPITFALNPQEANLMSFAQKKGKLQLIVRPPKEKQAYALPAATWDSLAEYMKDTQGIDIGLWGEKEKKQEEESPVEVPEFAPPIQVFRGGL